MKNNVLPIASILFETFNIYENDFKHNADAQKYWEIYFLC